MAPRALPESKLKARRRRRRAILLYCSIAGVVCLMGGVVALAHASFLRVSTISIEGTSAVATSTLEKFAREKLSGSYAFVLPKDNIFFYPKNSLQASVLAAFPELESASVHADSFTEVSVTVSGRHPNAVWCGSVFPPEGEQQCLLLDPSGLAYAYAPQFSGPVYLQFYGGMEATSSTPVQFLTPEVFRSLLPLVEAIEEKASLGMPQGVFIDTNADVHLVFPGDFTVLFPLQEDAGMVLDHFVLALSSAPFQAHALSDFEYLDLRFGNKLYEKLKNK